MLRDAVPPVRPLGLIRPGEDPGSKLASRRDHPNLRIQAEVIPGVPHFELLRFLRSIMPSSEFEQRMRRRFVKDRPSSSRKEPKVGSDR